MNIENMNINDIEARMGEIRTEMDALKPTSMP